MTVILVLLVVIASFVAIFLAVVGALLRIGVLTGPAPRSPYRGGSEGVYQRFDDGSLGYGPFPDAGGQRESAADRLYPPASADSDDPGIPDAEVVGEPLAGAGAAGQARPAERQHSPRNTRTDQQHPRYETSVQEPLEPRAVRRSRPREVIRLPLDDSRGAPADMPTRPRSEDDDPQSASPAEEDGLLKAIAELGWRIDEHGITTDGDPIGTAGDTTPPHPLERAEISSSPQANHESERDTDVGGPSRAGATDNDAVADQIRLAPGKPPAVAHEALQRQVAADRARIAAWKPHAPDTADVRDTPILPEQAPPLTDDDYPGYEAREAADVPDTLILADERSLLADERWWSIGHDYPGVHAPATADVPDTPIVADERPPLADEGWWSIGHDYPGVHAPATADVPDALILADERPPLADEDYPGFHAADTADVSDTPSLNEQPPPLTDDDYAGYEARETAEVPDTLILAEQPPPLTDDDYPGYEAPETAEVPDTLILAEQPPPLTDEDYPGFDAADTADVSDTPSLAEQPPPLTDDDYPGYRTREIAEVEDSPEVEEMFYETYYLLGLVVPPSQMPPAIRAVQRQSQ